jgi:hypothetical protein
MDGGRRTEDGRDQRPETRDQRPDYGERRALTQVVLWTPSPNRVRSWEERGVTDYGLHLCTIHHALLSILHPVEPELLRAGYAFACTH